MIKRYRMILSKKTFLKKIRYISVCSKTLYIYIYIYISCMYIPCMHISCMYICMYSYMLNYLYPIYILIDN